MNNSYISKFLKVYGTFVAIIIICLLYVINLQNAISSQNYNSFLLNPLLPYAMIPLLIIAAICNFWSYYILAKGKGYSGWLTLLAFLNLIGLLILIVLPNKYKAKLTNTVVTGEEI